MMDRSPPSKLVSAAADGPARLYIVLHTQVNDQCDKPAVDRRCQLS